MTKGGIPDYEDVTPNPEYLIKSIAEQGYSLESAVADLIDNSISAGADQVEILVNIESEPFGLMLADNGDGMTEKELREAMQFPSNSPEAARNRSDLGRFGLGLKTASFSQTRRFTVLSKKKDENSYHARTWDVDVLKDNGWKLIINNEQEIKEIHKKYINLSEQYLNGFENFTPNTIVYWSGLYKYEQYVDEKNRIAALKKEITEVTSEHLEIVFHRFMERKKRSLQIRINNKRLSPFSPFPVHEKDFRPVEPLKRRFGNDAIKIEGFILPSRSIDESKEANNIWTTNYRSLMGMEGIYVYRCDRVILFGGWNRLIKSGPRLQLARLRVDIGNGADNVINLNVSKSQVIIPHDLKKGFEEYITALKSEAEKEYFNRNIKRFNGIKDKNKEEIFVKKSSNKGVLLEFNDEFPLIKELKMGLDGSDLSKFLVLMKMINCQVNKIRHINEDRTFSGIAENDGITESDIKACVDEMRNLGMSRKSIIKKITEELGFKKNSMPDSLVEYMGGGDGK
ncbi:ATP-binding protein [Microbulbifer aggregans]|uniref:ATP-binding protein n=1 Tax=Microbulbifer aggregans TaxID=1769779 RepID=UPI001CFDDFA4|nr:ATP-binding protein [Microbulbifer aggregans]